MLQVVSLDPIQDNGQVIWRCTCDYCKCGVIEENCEIIFKNLPRDLELSKIFELFYEHKKTFMLRLMMDFSGYNRGYGFIKYMNPLLASQAIKKYNGYIIQNSILKVELSLENRKLFVANIPKYLPRDEVSSAFSDLEGFETIFIPQNHYITSVNRGFAILHFSDQHTASVARKLIPSIMYNTWNVIRPYVSWAREPKYRYVSHKITSKIVVYLRGFYPNKITEEDLECLLKLAVPWTSIRFIKNYGYFAFIHVKTRLDAERIISTLNGMSFFGMEIEATFALPQKKYKYEETLARPGIYSKDKARIN